MKMASHAKSKQMSTIYRQYGRDKSAQIALKYYNLALLFAVDGSEEMALAYGNRSYALWLLEAYAACVEDIERALSLQQLLRAATIDRLKKRKTQATAKMHKLIVRGTYQPHHLEQKQPDLFQGAQKNIPSFSTAVQLEFSHAKGRHIVANCDIPPGSVVLCEKPYACALYSSMYAERYCQHCCCPLPLNRVVCKQCANDDVRFCSEDCRDAAWSNYHWLECGHNVDAGYDTNPMKDAMLIGLRVLLSTEPQLLMNVEAKQLQAVYGTQKCAVSEDDDRFKWIASLSSASQSQKMVWRETVFGGYIRKFVWLIEVHGQSFLDRLRNEAPADSDAQIKAKVTNWLELFLRQSSLNAGPISNWPFDSKGIYNPELREIKHIGRGVYPTWSMFNHSCVPNCRTVFINGNQFVVRTVKHIRAGEELCITYGDELGDVEKGERQSALLRDFGFECNCEGCVDPKYIRLDLESQAFTCQACKSAGRGAGCVLLDEKHPVPKCMDCGHEPNHNTATTLMMMKEKFADRDSYMHPQLYSSFNREYSQTKELCHPMNDDANRWYTACAVFWAGLGDFERACALLIKDALPCMLGLFGANSMLVARNYERIYDYSVRGNYKKQAAKYRQMADRIYALQYGQFKWK